MAIFVLPAILMFFYATAAMHFRFTPDGTFVYLQFARNVINGDGISFTPGVPVYGIAGPLWMGLISLGGLMKIDLLLAAKLIDLFTASMALLVFFFVAYELIRDMFSAIAATLAFAMNVWFLQWAGTGMETSFAVLLLLGTLWFAIRNDYFTAIALAALFGLVRPEGWWIILPICADIYFNSFNKRRAFKMIAGLVLIFLAFIAPWLIYAWMTFGTTAPNVPVGSSGSVTMLGGAVLSVAGMVKTLILSDGISGTALVLGLLLLWFRSRGGEGPDMKTGTDIPVEVSSFYLFRSSIIPIGWVFLVCMIDVCTGSRPGSRELLLVSPIIVIFAFLFFHRVVHAYGAPKRVMMGVAMLSLAIMLQNQITYFTLVKPGIDDVERGMETCFIPIGKWFNQNTPPGTVLFAENVGALAYFSQRPVIDAAGVVSRAIVPLSMGGKTTEDVFREHSYRAFGAQYVVHSAGTPTALSGDRGLEAVLTDSISQKYPPGTLPVYYTIYKVLPDSASAH